jgi:ABC-type antimicrobial peptide transport system permease subunit
MGLRRSVEISSLCLELAAVLAFSLVLGAAIAVASALPVVPHVDLLPQYPPSPLAVVPWNVVWVALAGTLALALAAAALTSWVAGRADVSKELRVA